MKLDTIQKKKKKISLAKDFHKKCIIYLGLVLKRDLKLTRSVRSENFTSDGNACQIITVKQERVCISII